MLFRSVGCGGALAESLHAGDASHGRVVAVRGVSEKARGHPEGELVKRRQREPASDPDVGHEADDLDCLNGADPHYNAWHAASDDAE